MGWNKVDNEWDLYLPTVKFPIFLCSSFLVSFFASSLVASFSPSAGKAGASFVSFSVPVVAVAFAVSVVGFGEVYSDGMEL